MQNRFKLLRDEQNEKIKDKDPKAKIYTSKNLVEDLRKHGWTGTESKIRKIEGDFDDVTIDKSLLLAYKKLFNVSSDWLIDETVQTRTLTGDIAIASATTGLSDKAIKIISEYDENIKDLINRLVVHSPDLLNYLLVKIYLYVLSGLSSITINNDAFSGPKHIEYPESRNLLRFEVTQSFYDVLSSIDGMYFEEIKAIKDKQLEMLRLEIEIEKQKRGE